MTKLVRRITDGGDMTFGYGLANYAADSEAVAQNVRTRLQHLKGEWFLDTDSGVPYMQQIMGKPADIALASSLIKKTIAETDGVDSVSSFTASLDNVTRKLTVVATVTTIYGDTQDIRVNQ